jgi:hypothetical protein
MFHNFHKVQKRPPFAKDLITLTHPGFHIMVISGQLKTHNPNEKKALKNESKVAF